ncbi:hypothetical protein DRQ36_02670 [bacterium]|nr:MAG: hypothetical protein DRQ36_02670 [bacterium]
MVQKRTSGLIIVLIAIISVSTILWAGTAGKIKGVVTDKKTGEDLMGANIQVLSDAGTIIAGAAAGLDGEYVILNVPPGIYNLKASFTGYRPLTVTNVVVNVDVTTTVDFALEDTVLSSEPIVVIGEEEFRMDITGTERRTGRDELDNMPVVSVDDAIKMQAGIVEHEGQLHARGGRAREVTYMVDGMPITDPVYGSQGLEIAPSSVQEISVQTGSYNAEYGGALSGIINIVTREGDPNKFAGSLTYLTDDFGFSALNKYSRNDDRLELTLSGPEPVSTYLLPVFGLKLRTDKRISYFLSLTGENTDTRLPYNYMWDIDDHMPTDTPIDTPYRIDYGWFGLFPERRYNEYTATLKLKQRLTSSISYTITGTGSWTKYRRFDKDAGWEYIYTPSSAHIGERQSYQISLKWVHNVSPKTFYEIRAGYLHTRLDYTPGEMTPGDFAVDSSYWGSLDDWVDLNGDGVPQVRVKWWDYNHNGQWDFWEYWEPLIDYVDTVWADAAHTEIAYLDTVYIDERPPLLGEEPWFEVNDNDVFEPRQTNWNSYMVASPMDRPESFNDGEPFRDGMPFNMGFYGELLMGRPVLIDDTLWQDINGDGVKQTGEYVWGTYFRNDPLVPEEYHIAIEETTWHDDGDYIPAWGEYVDVNHDGTFTYRNDYCDFIDANGNGIYDVGEEGEAFIDLNGNGKYDGPDGKRQSWEPYIDVNGNGQWDDTDQFLDRGYDRWAVWHKRRSNVLMAKADLTSQVDKNNQVKTGVEFQYINMDMREIQYPEFKYDGEPDGYEYPEHGVFRSFYERTPKQFAWYIQDKMEYGGLIANIGVRLDVFLQAGEVLEDTVEEDLLEVLPEYDEIYKSQSKISPRLGMSYPITDRSKLFFSYAHLYQLPGYDDFYQTPTQASRAGRLLGNPNLDYEKTVTYELGVAYGITDDWTIEFSGYYKDIYDLLNTTSMQIGPLSQQVYKNVDYARSRGVELAITKAYSNRWMINANYQYSFAFGKSSSDRSGYDALFDQSAIPLQDLPLDWDQRHMINLVADYRVAEDDNPVVFGLKIPDKWGINLMFQYGSGFPYTPSARNPDWVAEPGEKDWERENALRKPANYNIDLKFNKDFSFAGMDYSFILWIMNLTDRRNVLEVYAETGEPDRSTIDIEEGTDFESNPSHWSAPRNIKFGLEIKW